VSTAEKPPGSPRRRRNHPGRADLPNHHPERNPELLKVTIYHNTESRFMPYEDGQQLIAVTSHWLPAPTSHDPRTVADWAYHAFNADLDMLEPGRDTGHGEITFLAACVYRLLGHRSLSFPRK
jgi:hypothetical protein